MLVPSPLCEFSQEHEIYWSADNKQITREDYTALVAAAEDRLGGPWWNGKLESPRLKGILATATKEAASWIFLLMQGRAPHTLSAEENELSADDLKSKAYDLVMRSDRWIHRTRKRARSEAEPAKPATATLDMWLEHY